MASRPRASAGPSAWTVVWLRYDAVGNKECGLGNIG